MDQNRSNIIQLRPGGEAPRANENPQKKQATPARPATGHAQRTALKAAALASLGILGVVRYLLFFLLTALRGPVRVLCGLFTFCSIIGLPVAFFGLPDGDPMRTTALTVFGVGLIAASAISWWYDSLLLRLSPGQMFMSL